ncbi:MAG: DUF2087 domain-containing protein [Rhodoferax sp.]|nr:DUF2087 domain-containing protein [Rhodoferax sp.]
MTRQLVPLHAPDISAFAKSLKTQLDARPADAKPGPSHLELLNILARAAGHRNFQAFKAAPPPPEAARAPAVVPADLSALSPMVRKTLMQFDAAGRLVRLPHKFSVQQMAMWAMWTRFVVRRKYTEKEVNLILNAHHTFGDPATLRRELVNMKLLGRKSDCSQYWKEPQRPGDEVQGFLKALRQNSRVSPPRQPRAHPTA